ncbi:MBL fold metallo-hydrolase [Fictibacillus sp. WQ 8-8]|uniref:MBL fold metallo-hydrolase n=1 Tax=Fictibacillus sp. WQ 8-8 TaxID=2938788 RepID=UPI0021098120|nr:MBL fold metallo-hydrolase [Fictibacillus sp. WQ 8-8]MCQ6265122.1 MBL fold metallo-hydrolase [Fictibacillus sp. WQ 8-8]
MFNAIPILKPVAPSITFTDRLVLHGTKRRAELLTYGGGHTDSDSILYFPDDKVLFSADLVVIDNHPWMGAGQPEEWLTILDRMAMLDFHTVVPRHDPAGRQGAEHLEPVRRYITEVLNAVQNLKDQGIDSAEAANLDHLEFTSGSEPAGFLGKNISALLSQTKAAQSV